MRAPGRSQTLVLNFFLVFFVLLLVPPSFYHKPVAGLDTSWNIALHLAYKYHLTFGKDFIFTYGPLGILHSRYPIAVSLFVYLIFDLYFLLTLFFVLRKIFRKHFGPFIILFTFLCIVLVMYDSPDDWCYFLLAFYIVTFIQEPSEITYLIQAALFAVLGFYLKISLGFIGVFLFFAAISYAAVRKKISVKFYLIALVSFILSLWLSSRVLNVNLKGYISSGLKFINDYNDSMFKFLDAKDVIYLYGALLIIVIAAFWTIYRLIISISRKEMLQNLDELFVYSIVGISLFILFKSGFVRAENHYHIFFKGATLFMTFLYLGRPVNAGGRITAVACWFTVIISFAAVSKMPGSYHPDTRLADFSFLENKAREIGRYFRQVVYYNQALAVSDGLDSLENPLKKIIGNHTVDIIPSEISKIYFNGLRYNPRPVIQSYAAYDRYLDSLNYQKYLSADAPDYVLLTIGSIDDRYPFFDESMTKLALLNNYRITGELDGDLILRKKVAAHHSPKTQNEETVNLKFGEDIPIKKTNDLQYARFFVEYSLWGKIKRFFYQPSALMITFTLDDGTTKTFRAVKPILADGVIINKYVENTQDFQILMQSDGLQSTDIKKIRIGPDGRHSGFRDNIKMVTVHVPFATKQDSDRVADSLDIVTLENRYKPVKMDSSLVKQDSIQYGIRDFNTYSGFIEVRGWAFRENANNRNASVKAVLKSKDGIYELPSVKEDREDLTSHFKREDIKAAGFISTVSKSQLEPGDYQLGIAVSYPDSGKNWVRYIKDVHTLIRSAYKIEKLKGIDSAALNKNDLKYYLSSIEENKDQVLVDGWAFIENTDTRGARINLILQNRGLIYKINTDIVRRDDLISYFKDPLLGFGGFSVIIPKSALPNGTYTLGVEVIWGGGRQHGLKFGDQKIKVESVP